MIFDGVSLADQSNVIASALNSVRETKMPCWTSSSTAHVNTNLSAEPLESQGKTDSNKDAAEAMSSLTQSRMVGPANIASAGPRYINSHTTERRFPHLSNRRFGMEKPADPRRCSDSARPIGAIQTAQRLDWQLLRQ